MVRRAGVRALVRATVVCAVGLGAAAVPAEAQDETQVIEVLVELRIERGPSADFLALAAGPHLLLGAHAFLALAEIDISAVSPGRRLSGVMYPAGMPFTIDTDSSIVRAGDLVSAIPSGRATWREGELYVATSLLEVVLGVRFQTSLSELVVLVRETGRLPVVQRLQRDRVRRRSEQDRETAEVTSLSALPRRPVDGAVLDWAVSSATEDPFGASSVELGLGALVFGGSGVVQHMERRAADVSERSTTGSWTRVWHTTRWLRQVRLGEVVGTGPRARVLQGAVVTNSPFVRPATFAASPLEGVFGPGWEVELYRGFEFLNATRSDESGRYLFEVPVIYGQNPLEVVGYGPTGEIVRLRRTFEIPAERFPRGQFEYGVGAGGCAFDPCDAQANLDLRYGVTGRLTLGGGVSRFWRDTLPDLWHPYASGAFQATRSLMFFAEAVANAQVAGRTRYAPTQDLQVEMGHTWFTGDVIAPLIGSASDNQRTDASVFFRPSWWDYRTFLRAVAVRSSGPGRTHDFVQVLASVRFNGARVDVAGTLDRQVLNDAPATTGTTIDLRYSQLYGGRLRWLRSTLLRAELRSTLDSGPVAVRALGSRSFNRVLQVETGIGWDRALGISLEVGLTAALRQVRAVSRNRISRDGGRGVQMAEGSVLWDTDGRRLDFEDGRSLGRAGVTGEVFLDANGNRARDPGEEPAADVLVRIGPIATRTDETGRFVVWDLVPFEAVVAEIDPGSIQNPLWLPSSARFTFRPDPNTFVPIPLPLVLSGEVSGLVVVEPEGTLLRGVTVELRNLETDDRYTATTFSDGTFYLLGVRPGRYAVAVPADLLTKLGLTGEAWEVRVGPTADDLIIEGLVLPVQRR